MKNKQTNVRSFAVAKLQAKRLRLLAIIALAALIGFSMAACGDDSGPTGGGGGGGSSRLTVTGLPSDSSNWTATVYPAGTDIFNSYDRAIAGYEASHRSESSGNVFVLTGDRNTPYWTKSGSFPVRLHEKSAPNGTGYGATVNFSNGSATVPFSNFRWLD